MQGEYLRNIGRILKVIQGEYYKEYMENIKSNAGRILEWIYGKYYNEYRENIRRNTGRILEGIQWEYGKQCRENIRRNKCMEDIGTSIWRILEGTYGEY